MSWATFEAILDDAFTGYTKIPEGKDIEQMPDNKHKVYSLKWIGMGGIILHTSNNISYAHKVKLRVSYINMESDTRETNADLFITLLTTIAGLSGFNQFITDTSFEDMPSHPEQTIGEAEFYFGVDGLC